MRKLIIGFLLGFFICSGLLFARENLVDFEEKSINTLNEIIKDIWRAIDNINVYGNINVKDNGADTVIAASGVANKVQFLFFDTNGEFNDTTPNHVEDHIEIDKAGKYLIVISIHAESVAAGGAATFGFEAWKNNGTIQLTGIHGHRKLAGGGGDVGSIHISGIADLDVNDTVELWVYEVAPDTDNIELEDVSMTISKFNG